MTEQEAAEIVLKEDKFIQCSYCVGSDDPSGCARCGGHGKLVRERYLQACRVLSIPFSIRGWSLD